MLRSAWFVAIHDLLLMLRQRETLVWTFLIPPFVFYFVGTITAGGVFSYDRPQIAVQAESGAGFLGEQVLSRLEEQRYRVARFDAEGNLVDADGERVEIEAPPAFTDYGLRLRIPEGFTESVLTGERVVLTLENDGDDLFADLNDFRLYRAVYTVLADVLAASGVAAGGGAATGTGAAAGARAAIGDGIGLSALTAEDIEAFRGAERTLSLEVGTAGRRIPSGFEQAVPGITVMFTLLVLLTSGTVSLVIERRTGLLRRLASAPIARGAVVLGKWGGKYGLAIIQVAFALLIGRFVLGVDFGPEWPMLVATLAAYTALIASLAVLVGNVATSEGQAIAIGVLSANVLGALGGCFWPIEVTPDYMQQLALFVPTGWMMDAMHELMIFGRDWTAALPHLIGMSAGAWLLGIVSARRFRFQ